MLDPIWNPDTLNDLGSSQNLVNTTRAIWNMANAATWDDTYQVLHERKALLLTDRAKTLLQIFIETSFENNDVADAENWQQYLSLLEEAKTSGIDMAWEHFIDMQNKAIEALETFTNATTYDAQYAVLARKQKVLLSETARVILRGSISKQRSKQHEQVVEHLERLLRLLEDAQTHGINIAWKTYRES